MNSIDPNQKRFRLKLIYSVAAVCLFITQALGQDPLKTLPQAYKLQFENEWVKVTRVHYAPHEKLPPHQHTLTGSAYVYLNDGGPVVFKHLDLPYGAVTRPATKAGSFRLYGGLKEVHEVENLSELPSDFLRVEFKTEPVNERTLRGRFYRETYPVGENFEKVQFENEQVRITRIVCGAGKKIEISTPATQPVLLIALVPSSLKVSDGKHKSSASKLATGETRWIAAGQQESIENSGNAPAELLRFDFKTKPLSKDMLDKDKKHEHQEK